MPQPWTTVLPWRCLKPAIIDRGAAEPPTSMECSFERSQRSGSLSSMPRMPIQIVGTPAVIVTPSRSNVLEQRLGIEERAGEDELRAHHEAGVGVAPRVRMEHRHDRQKRLLLGHVQAERRRERLTERVQHRRAMRVENALRHPRRAARVAHGRGRILVEAGILVVVRIGSREQLLVGVLDDEDVLDRRPVRELLPERQQRAVDDHGLVARVGGDVGEIVRMQAQVERVQDVAGARDAEVGLEVLVVVPAKRGDAGARLEPEPLERDRQLPRAAAEVGERVAVEAPVGKPRDDLLVREVRLRPLQDRRQRQLEVHHQTLHGCLLLPETLPDSQRPPR